MKQARWWLLLAAATLAVPTEAFAQNKKAPAAPAGKPAPAAGAPAAGAAAGGVVDLDAPGPATGAPAGTNGAAAGGAIDLDGPQPNNGAGAGTGTLLNAQAAGNHTKWVPIDDNVTHLYDPSW
mgnify:CR=1 FL=1